MAGGMRAPHGVDLFDAVPPRTAARGPGCHRLLSEGDTARQIVFSVRLGSATPYSDEADQRARPLHRGGKRISGRLRYRCFGRAATKRSASRTFVINSMRCRSSRDFLQRVAIIDSSHIAEVGARDRKGVQTAHNRIHLCHRDKIYSNGGRKQCWSFDGNVHYVRFASYLNAPYCVVRAGGVQHGLYERKAAVNIMF